MSKKKKKKKGIPQQQLGGYKRFLSDMNEALLLIGNIDRFSKMSNKFKRQMYDSNLGIQNPVAANEFISSKELKLITEKTKRYYREKTMDYANKKISTYQLQLIHCHTNIMHKVIEKETGIKNHNEAITFKKLASGLLDVYYSRYLLEYFRMITQLSNPAKKYIGVNIHPAALLKEYPKFELVTEIYGIPARKSFVKINGHPRPVFQLGKAVATTPVEWIELSTTILEGFYTGNKLSLEVFIQSHALSRMQERLNLLDQEALNYALWVNTNNIQEFITYKNYLLLPFEIFNVKIGYLVAHVVDEKLLFRTFLFITHNSTPEGDKLKEISGLGKHDISYWKIDRLSTFMNIDEEKYPTLNQLFCDAGLKDIMQLKNKEFSVDAMQSANLDGLTAYVNKGK